MGNTKKNSRIVDNPGEQIKKQQDIVFFGYFRRLPEIAKYMAITMPVIKTKGKLLFQQAPHYMSLILRMTW